MIAASTALKVLVSSGRLPHQLFLQGCVDREYLPSCSGMVQLEAPCYP